MNAGGADDAFLYVKQTTDTLQAAAKSSRHQESKALTPALIKSLVFLNHSVQTALCSYGMDSNRDLLTERLVASARKSLQISGRECDDMEISVAASRVTEFRRKQLAVEIDILDTLPFLERDSHFPSAKLARCITLLRGLETDLNLHASMAMEVQKLVDSSDYSDINFAYGSTPYSSWHEVVQHPHVNASIHSAMHGRTCMVWGSSTGWLVFYAALTYGWSCVGYELLESLHRSAVTVQLELELGSGNTNFVNADMLCSPLSAVGLLVLANQCWDQDLMHQAASKLTKELPEGAVVIEYRSSLTAFGKAGHGPRMTELAAIVVPVSWNENQCMHIYRKEGVDKTAEV